MQIVYALYECHRRKDKDKKLILHRNLKPENIFLDEKMNIKIGDFGFAKEVNPQTQYANTYVGTICYMSPEQLNEQNYNEKCDIWSLGCIIYELTSLELPFKADNTFNLAKKIKAGEIAKRIPKDYSDELMRVIKWMLKPDPKQRANVEDLLNVPHVSTILREKSLRQNVVTMKKREEEVKKKENFLKEKEEELNKREQELAEKERQIEEMERAV
jgi:serine/threonine protein kinase